MLNVSQVNLTTCLSVMFQLFAHEDGIVAPLSRLEEDPAIADRIAALAVEP